MVTRLPISAESRRAAILAALLAYFFAPAAWAQTDYRNLGDDRPVATEDAYPVERYGFELVVPYHFEVEAGGLELHSSVPEIAYGVLRNAQIGVKLPLAAVDRGLGTDWGLAGIRVFGLYNLNTESAGLPAVSVRADAGFPVGSLAGEGSRLSLKAIATRSWGRTRAHLNASRSFGSETFAVVEPMARWSASLALDQTFFRSSFLLIAEVATVELIEDSPSEVTATLGGRLQWTPTLVLDFGLTRRLGDRGPDFGVTIGLSHAFAIRALMPGAP
jgi:hypothetical protein